MIRSVLLPYNFVSLKKSCLSATKFPIVKDSDIEFKNVKSSGPGGQNVNKRNTCCFMRHKETGIAVKCQTSRSAARNLKEAKILLSERVDTFYKGENSWKNTDLLKRITETKLSKEQSKERHALIKSYKNLLSK